MNGIAAYEVLDMELLENLEAMAVACHNDENFLSRVEADAYTCLEEIGYPLTPGVDASIVMNTPEKFHVIFPDNPNTELLDESLMNVSGGGKCAGSAGTVSTGGSASTIPSCVSSVSSGSSASTAGSSS